MVRITRLRFEHHEDGSAIGVGETRPRISWSFEGEEGEQGWVQGGYEVEIKRENGEVENASVHAPDNILVPCI